MGELIYLLLPEHSPVEDVVVAVVEGPEEQSEELSEVHVVWGLFKPVTCQVLPW